jgi:hypothetical protein
MKSKYGNAADKTVCIQGVEQDPFGVLIERYQGKKILIVIPFKKRIDFVVTADISHFLNTTGQVDIIDVVGADLHLIPVFLQYLFHFRIPIDLEIKQTEQK